MILLNNWKVVRISNFILHAKKYYGIDITVEDINKDFIDMINKQSIDNNISSMCNEDIPKINNFFLMTSTEIANAIKAWYSEKFIELRWELDQYFYDKYGINYVYKEDYKERLRSFLQLWGYDKKDCTLYINRLSEKDILRLVNNREDLLNYL